MSSSPASRDPGQVSRSVAGQRWIPAFAGMMILPSPSSAISSLLVEIPVPCFPLAGWDSAPTYRQGSARPELRA